MSASTSKRTPADGPAWLDQVLGSSSPPFSFRKGGSAITSGADDTLTAQKSASAKTPGKTSPRTKTSQQG